MKEERIAELVKAARERINGPPGSRGILLLPEEVLELLEGNLVVETTQDTQDSPAAMTSVDWTRSSAGGPWDAAGRIAAAFIAKQPPGLKADKVATYVSDVIRDVRQKAEI